MQTKTSARTDEEWLEAFRRGERVQNEHTLTHFKTTPELCKKHYPRDVVCAVDKDGDDRDVLECMHCGKQWEAACTFDEDFA